MQAIRILLLIGAATVITGCERPSATAGPEAESAQPNAMHRSLAADIHRTISGVTGHDPRGIVVAVRIAQVIVEISEGKLLESGHAERDREAETISAAIVQVLQSAGAAEGIQAIHVDYIRPTSGLKPKVIDSIDFRKSPDGKFLKDVT